MVMLGIAYLVPFAYGTAYLVHCVKKRRLPAALGMLLLLCAQLALVVLLLRYRAGS